MKKQTFVICLEDRNSMVVDFERWSFKRAQTCIDHMIELYKTYSIYWLSLAKADKLVCYPTPDGYHKEAPVWSVSVDEFRELMRKDGAA